MPNILGRGLRYFVEAVKYAAAPFTNPTLRRILFDYTRVPTGTVGEEADVGHYLRLAACNPAVFASITTIADRVSDTGVFLVKRKAGAEWVDVADHPLPGLLMRPNSLMSGSLLLSDTAWWYELLGNAYWFLVTDTPGRGPIREIWPLPADRVRPDPMTLRISAITGKPVIDYAYQLGSIITLPGENVVHFRTANPFDPWRGLSKLSPLQNNLTMDSAQLKWLGSYYDKGNAVPASIVSVPPTLDDADFDAVVRDIQDQFGGKRQTAVVRAGDLKVEVIQHSIADMQVVENRAKNAEEVRRVFKIPEGLNSAASGQSRLAAETALARDAIQPLLNYFAETLTLTALVLYGDGEGFKVEAENIIPQDVALDISEYQAYAPDRTINENRKKQDLPPLTLKGDLAAFQALVDEVPQQLITVLAPLLVQKAGGGAMGGLPGGLGTPAPALSAHAQLLQMLTGGQAAQQPAWNVVQPQALPGPTGPQGPDTGDATPGYRVSGLPVAVDPIQQLLGAKAALSAPEQDAALYAALNQYIIRPDATAAPLVAALLFHFQGERHAL